MRKSRIHVVGADGNPSADGTITIVPCDAMPRRDVGVVPYEHTEQAF